MYYPLPNRDKLMFSVFAISALSYLMIKQRDAVGLITFSDGIREQTQQKSTRTHLNSVLQLLEQVINSPRPEPTQTNIAETIHLIADKIHKRSLVIIFTDMFQQADSLQSIFEALQHLKHNKHEVLLFHTTDQKTEKTFNFDDRPYQFIDLETKKTITLNPSSVKEVYTEKMDSFYKEIKLACGKLKIDMIEADVQDDFSKILSSYLIKRKRMG
jgi:uncharacterized protein (DUF58 family)